MHRAAFALLCTCLATAVASADGTVDDVRQWTSVHVSHRYDDRFSFGLLSQVRFSDDVSEYDEMVLKPAARYVVAPGFNLTLGYHFANEKDSPDEHRVWEQLAFARSFADLDLGLRGRLEQRFINHLGGTIVRNRYRLSLAPYLGLDKRGSFANDGQLVAFALQGLAIRAPGRRQCLLGVVKQVDVA